MKTALIVLATALTAVAARADQPAEAEYGNVIICTQLAASKDMKPVLATVSGMFAEIGVTIDWRPKLERCPAEGIKITLRFNAPPSEHPGAFAFALPYEGAHICVLYDRVRNQGREFLPDLMAHVIAHEVTHMLQGVPRHSKAGLMKAQWSRGDIEGMKTRKLAFTAEDILEIRRGLAARALHFHLNSYKTTLARK